MFFKQKTAYETRIRYWSSDVCSSDIWHQLSPIFRGGRMSMPTQKVLDAVGLGRELNIRLGGVKDHENIWPFEIRRRRPRGTTQSSTALLRPQGREHLNDQLGGLITEWLAVASEQDRKDTGLN